MKSTVQKLILVSFILALVASAFIFSYLKSLNSPKPSLKKITVIVAADNIPARTLIDKKMIKEIEVSDDTIFTDYLKSPSDIVGKYTKETISKNESFHSNKLLNKDSSELTLKLPDNYRAVSINVTGSSGVSDLVEPGDFVDIIVYLAEKRDGAEVVRPEIAKLILQNIEVLAVDKQLNRDDNKAPTADKEKIMTSFLVTLSVKDTDVEKVALAEGTGSLKLALRPIKDDNTEDTKGTTWQELSVNSYSSNTTAKVPENSAGKTSSVNNNSKGYTEYTIKPGDTLEKISSDFYGDSDKYTIIKEANNIQNIDLIVTGTVIKIPVLK